MDATEEMMKMLRDGRSCVLGWDREQGKMTVKEIVILSAAGIPNSRPPISVLALEKEDAPKLTWGAEDIMKEKKEEQ